MVYHVRAALDLDDVRVDVVHVLDGLRSEHLGGGAVGVDAALLEHYDPVGELRGYVQVVAYHQDHDALLMGDVP